MIQFSLPLVNVENKYPKTPYEGIICQQSGSEGHLDLGLTWISVSIPNMSLQKQALKIRNSLEKGYYLIP